MGWRPSPVTVVRRAGAAGVQRPRQFRARTRAQSAQGDRGALAVGRIGRVSCPASPVRDDGAEPPARGASIALAVWLPSLAGRRPSAADSGHALICVARCARVRVHAQRFGRGRCLLGLAPALQSARPDGADTLKKESAGSDQASQFRCRNALVVAQLETFHLCCWSTLTSSSAAFSRCIRSNRTSVASRPLT